MQYVFGVCSMRFVSADIIIIARQSFKFLCYVVDAASVSASINNLQTTVRDNCKLGDVLQIRISYPK